MNCMYFNESLFLSSQLVAGSVVMAFEEVCPDRIDLIHRNYRKLCNLLVDVEEWGQVVIIHMLTRYARTQFVSPWREVSADRPPAYDVCQGSRLTLKTVQPENSREGVEIRSRESSLCSLSVALTQPTPV